MFARGSPSRVKWDSSHRRRGSVIVLGQAILVRTERYSQSSVVTLASYGNAGHNIYNPMTPFHISSEKQSIGLIAANHGDQIAVGLLLMGNQIRDSGLRFYDGMYQTDFDNVFFRSAIDSRPDL
jgi:hypothetical protein